METDTPRRLQVSVCPSCAAVVAFGPGAAHHLQRHVVWGQLAADEVADLQAKMEASHWMLTR